MAENDFKNSPFAGLNARMYPKKSTEGRDAEERLRERRRFRKETSPEEQKELSLSLRAMDGVEPERERGHAVRGRGGKGEAPAREGSFSMAMLGGMDGVEKLPGKKGKKKKKAASLARTAAAAASATGSETGPETGFETAPEEEQSMASLLAGEGFDREFAKAMANVEPLNGRGRDVAPPVEAAPAPEAAGGNALQDFLDGKLEFALSFTDEYIEGYVVGLDSITVNKLRQGSYSPEASLDLHGLNVLQAFEALRGFFKSAWYRGIRCVVVVPGRGKNSPDGIGILREKLQLWLTQEPFKRIVLAFCTAQPHDGGPGSLYVLLRKFKKKGRVYWERMPADEDLF